MKCRQCAPKVYRKILHPLRCWIKSTCKQTPEEPEYQKYLLIFFFRGNLISSQKIHFYRKKSYLYSFCSVNFYQCSFNSISAGILCSQCILVRLLAYTVEGITEVVYSTSSFNQFYFSIFSLYPTAYTMPMEVKLDSLNSNAEETKQICNIGIIISLDNLT